MQKGNSSERKGICFLLLSGFPRLHEKLVRSHSVFLVNTLSIISASSFMFGRIIELIQFEYGGSMMKELIWVVGGVCDQGL